jgi:hypothetical protein
VVILDKTDLNYLNKNILFLTKKINFNYLINENPFLIFDKLVISFFEEISNKIINDNKIKKLTDLITFGFYCRKSNIENIKKNYLNEIQYRSGRGVALHFTAANVPLNFAYSFLFSLLSGNVTLIRLGSKKFDQNDILIKLINKILSKKKFFSLKKRILLFYSEKNKKTNDILSNICDVRVIWGGDETINNIRNSKIKPHGYDITFSNKYSATIINADKYLKLEKTKVSRDFFNDTFIFDQNGCNSPRIVFWTGNEKNIFKANKIFWSKLHDYMIFINYKQNSYGYNKNLNEVISFIDLDVANFFKNIYFSVLTLKKIPKNFENYLCPGGFFFQINLSSKKQISQFVNEKFQTLSTIGVNNDRVFKDYKINEKKGIFRIVDNGKAANFGIFWDGYDIIRQTSKITSFN